MPDWMIQRQFCEAYASDPEKLREDRLAGRGLPWTEKGGRIYYDREAMDEKLKQLTKVIMAGGREP